MTYAHALTSLLLAVLAITMGARFGIPRPGRGRVSVAFLWSLVVLVAMIAVGFFARAQAGDAFRWFHALILGALIL